MSTKELEDFASTKHKGLPDKVDEISYRKAMKSFQKAMRQGQDADDAGDKETSDKKFDQAGKFGRYASKKYTNRYASKKFKKEDNEITNRSAAMKPQTYNDPKTGRKKVRMVPVNTNIVKTNDRVDEAFKKGDVVKVNTGPHKHLKHEVIHAFDDGTYNIKPYDLAPSKNRYRGGAVQVKGNQIKKLDEEMDPTKHVSKKGDMYCVYNKAGKEVAKFDDEGKANAYARKNHDKLMEYLEVGTDKIRKSYASMTPGQKKKDFKKIRGKK